MTIVAVFAVLGVMFFAGNIVSAQDSDTSEGNVTLNITAVTEINFTDDSIDLGAGHVISGADNATITTYNVVERGTWTPRHDDFIIENIGTENVTLDLRSSQNASTLIGGSTPRFQWMMSSVEANTCSGNYLVFPKNVSTTDETVCGKFNAGNANDD